MKLYYSKGACSIAVHIIINEIGVPCEFESVSLKTKKTGTGADFLKINPKGAVPTLLLDNNEVLTENAVIQQYLADTYKATQLLPPVGDFQRYRVLEWLNFISTDLHKGAGPFFSPLVSEKIKEDVFRPLFKSKLQHVADHLKQNKYLMGDQFTLPDAYLFVILSWLPHFKIDISEWPHLEAYLENLKQRKSVQQAIKEEN